MPSLLARAPANTVCAVLQTSLISTASHAVYHKSAGTGRGAPRRAVAAPSPKLGSELTSGARLGTLLEPRPPAALEDAPPLKAAYDVGRQVGRGSFAMVLEVTDRRTGERLCAKQLPRFCHLKPPFQQARQVASEAATQQLLGAASDRILALRDVRQDDSFYYLISELCVCDLKQYLRGRQPLPEREAAHIMHQLLAALDTCHSHGVAYSDVKPANLLVRSLGTGGASPDICLADFGCSRSVNGPRPAQRSSPGTPLYSAPECLHGSGSISSDIWSAGILLYEMLSAGFPFCDPAENICQSEYWRRVEQAPITFSGHAWHGVSPGAVALLKRMLDRNPCSRTTAAEALQDPWLLDMTSHARSASTTTSAATVRTSAGRVVGNVLPNALPSKAPAMMLPSAA